MLVDQRTLDTSTIIHPFRAVEELVALLHRAPVPSSDNLFPGIAVALRYRRTPHRHQRGLSHAAGLRTAHSLLMLLARSRIETKPTMASASITGTGTATGTHLEVGIGLTIVCSGYESQFSSHEGLCAHGSCQASDT